MKSNASNQKLMYESYINILKDIYSSVVENEMNKIKSYSDFSEVLLYEYRYNAALSFLKAHVYDNEKENLFSKLEDNVVKSIFQNFFSSQFDIYLKNCNNNYNDFDPEVLLSYSRNYLSKCFRFYDLISHEINNKLSFEIFSINTDIKNKDFNLMSKESKLLDSDSYEFILEKIKDLNVLTYIEFVERAAELDIKVSYKKDNKNNHKVFISFINDVYL